MYRDHFGHTIASIPSVKDGNVAIVQILTQKVENIKVVLNILNETLSSSE